MSISDRILDAMNEAERLTGQRIEVIMLTRESLRAWFVERFGDERVPTVAVPGGFAGARISEGPADAVMWPDAPWPKWRPLP